MPLVSEGSAASLIEAARDFALSHPGDGKPSWSVGDGRRNSTASLDAIRKARCAAALDLLSALRQAFSGEPR